MKMVTQHYDDSDYTGTDTYFIVNSSQTLMYEELNDFIKEYGTKDNEIWVYINPVKPNKDNLRPEFSMEIIIREKPNNFIVTLYSKVWG